MIRKLPPMLRFGLLFCLALLLWACQSGGEKPETKVETTEQPSTKLTDLSETPRFYEYLPLMDSTKMGFGSLRWGMSGADCRLAMMKSVLNIGVNRLREPTIEFHDSLFNMPAQVFLSFYKNQLYMVHARFDAEQQDSTTMRNVYERLRAVLSNQFGDPTWVRADADTIGAGAVWSNEYTEIVLGYLSYKEYEPEISVRMTSLAITRPSDLPQLL